MTRIDFYILQDLEREAAMRFACRLSLKGCLAGHPVHIHVADGDNASALDELMWDYPKHRFMPHEILRSEAPPTAPIHIGYTTPALQEGLLINLAQDVPAFFGRFDRVAEVVVETDKAHGRARYKHYRDRGLPLHHHEIADWEED